MNLFVFFLVGAPTVGKDTFVSMCQHYPCSAVHNLSSIDCIRDLLNISKDDKRPETRKVLSVVGAALEEYNHYRSRTTAMLAFNKLLNDLSLRKEENFSSVVFIHVREAYMIERMQEVVRQQSFAMFGTDTVKTRTVKVVNDRVSTNFSNDSDREAHNMQCDIAIPNHGTLEHLQELANTFMQATQQPR